MIWSSFILPALGSLMGIDYGNEFFKVSVIQAGRPIEIASNVHSKRKTETAVSFFEPIRLFGTDAVPHELRGRAGAYFFSNRILGLHAKEAGNFLDLDPNYFSASFLVNTTRETVIYDTLGGMSAEAVHGHIFNYAKKIAEDANEQRQIKDAVICIPSDARQRVRQAYLAAAEIADLKPQLIHTSVAAAVQLALDFESNDVQNYLFYNMGARLTEVCIVEFSSRAAGMVAGRTAPNLYVRGCAVDHKLGGLFADIAIADYMLKVFKEKHPKIAGGIDNNLRARKKLLAQSKKTKQVLSANKASAFNIGSFHEDTDFQASIERTEFEALIQDSIVGRLTAVVEDALVAANMTKDEVDQVELIGGAWRIPIVVEKLSAYFVNPEKPKLELGQHLNGEEAMVMGAALFGANSSSVFRVKRIFLQDVARYNYSIDILNNQGEEIRNRTVLATAFSTKLNFKKKISLANHTEDFVVKLYEDEEVIATYNLAVASIMETVNVTENTTQKVSFIVRADDSGYIQLIKPEVVTELTYEDEVLDEEIAKLKLQLEVMKMYDDFLIGEEAQRLANMTDDEKIAAEAKKLEEESLEKELASLIAEDAAEMADKLKKKDEEKAKTLKTDGEEKEKKEEKKEEKTEEKTEEKQDPEEKKKKKERKQRKEKLQKDADLKKTMDKLKKEKKLRELAQVADIPKVYKTVSKKKKANSKIIVDTLYSMPQPMDLDAIAVAKAQLEAMSKRDLEAGLIDEAKNTLESAVYAARDKLDDSVMQRVLLEDDREKVRAMTVDIEEWLYGDGNTAELSTFHQRLAGLRELMEPAQTRASEIEKRADVEDKVGSQLQKVTDYQAQCQEMDWLNQTKVEIATQKLTEFKTFWDDAVGKQKHLKDHEEPAYIVANVLEKVNQVTKAWSKLSKTKKPKDVKPSVKTAKLDLTGKSLTDLVALMQSTKEKKNRAVLEQDYELAHIAKLEEEQLVQALNDSTFKDSETTESREKSEKTEKTEL